jgi:chemotaxis signal transduction protein
MVAAAPDLVLQRRAARLAQPLSAESSGDVLELLEFTVAGQACALELAWLREVRGPRGVAALPLAERPVLGVAHVRGRMLPVFGIGWLLGLAAPAETVAKLVVVGRGGAGFAFAVAADEVRGLRHLARGDVQRGPDSLAAARTPLVAGWTPAGHLVLDGANLVAACRAHLRPS